MSDWRHRSNPTRVTDGLQKAIVSGKPAGTALLVEARRTIIRLQEAMVREERLDLDRVDRLAQLQRENAWLRQRLPWWRRRWGRLGPDDT